MEAHVKHAERALAIEQAQALNRKNPSVPNRTKVVRLFVVPPCLNPDNAKEVADYVRGKNPTREDVFVLVSKDGRLRPATWHGKTLLDHKKAHHLHIDTAATLSNADREQIEWQCDVPFKVSRIQRDSGHQKVFPSVDGHLYPFMTPLKKLLEVPGGPGTPIRSGPTKVLGKGGNPKWSQFYKAHFKLYINGEWRTLDPDFYCDR